MSKIAFKPSDTGTGTLEITAPSTNTTREIELPDADGLLFNQGNIVGTVSQSGGVPTGAILERGSNANGAFIKYADGTLICTGQTDIQSCATPQLSIGGFYNIDVCSGTFAHTFAAVPIVVSTPWRQGGTGTGRIHNGQVGSTSVSNTGGIRAIAETSGHQVLFYYTAVGRWY